MLALLAFHGTSNGLIFCVERVLIDLCCDLHLLVSGRWRGQMSGRPDHPVLWGWRWPDEEVGPSGPFHPSHTGKETVRDKYFALLLFSIIDAVGFSLYRINSLALLFFRQLLLGGFSYVHFPF
jgi:hypothetical protein